MINPCLDFGFKLSSGHNTKEKDQPIKKNIEKTKTRLGSRQTQFIITPFSDCSRVLWATWVRQSAPCSDSRERQLDSLDTWCTPSFCGGTHAPPRDSSAAAARAFVTLVLTDPTHRYDSHCYNIKNNASLLQTILHIHILPNYFNSNIIIIINQIWSHSHSCAKTPIFFFYLLIPLEHIVWRTE